MAGRQACGMVADNKHFLWDVLTGEQASPSWTHDSDNIKTTLCMLLLLRKPAAAEQQAYFCSAAHFWGCCSVA